MGAFYISRALESCLRKKKKKKEKALFSRLSSPECLRLSSQLSASVGATPGAGRGRLDRKRKKPQTAHLGWGGRVLQRYKKIEIKNKLLAGKGREGQR